ncbi:BamA/TamA family outer membrane protein [Aquimarina agarilytica]|uniref:BamA/TamA family outer membrane protein n=1 Tax=Aquimarina agarilytica TaxID=1087449 RepID=UPI0002893816|nr:BamA/TamA family outer membrane protein [Aquimarina agarilytica]
MLRLKSSLFLCLFICLGCYTSGVSQTPDNKLHLHIKQADSIQKQLSFGNYNQLQIHIDSLANQLHQQGYLTAFYQKPVKKNDSTYVTKLFKKELIQQVVIQNWKQLPLIIKKNAGLKKSNVIPIVSLQKKIAHWNFLLSNEGNPFNSLQLKNIYNRNDTLYANLHFEGIETRKLDSIIVKGYPKFPRGFLTHYIGIKKRSLYQNKKIQEKTQQLNNLPFVNTIKPAEVLFNPKSTQLYVYLKKKNANNFDGFLGFSTDEETGDLVLDGYLNLSLRNNLNYGEELNLSYKSDSEEQQQFKILAKLPYLFKLPLGLEAGLYNFRQKEVFSTTEQKIGLNYVFTPKIEALLGYKKYESADLSDSEFVAGGITEDFDARFLHIEARYIKKQNRLLFPVKTSAILSTEMGSRSQKDKNTQQLKLGLQLSHIFQLNKRNSIYIANNAQFFNSDTYLNNELYRLGGILSIRGFEENSLRASIFNVLNTEYRFQLNETIYAHSIIDFAFIDNQSAQSSANPEPIGQNQLTSFGVGLGMLTKAGLFKLNYANGTSDDIPFEFGNSKIHLSLTAFF